MLCQRIISLQDPEQSRADGDTGEEHPEQTATLAKMKVGREQSSPDHTVTQNKDLRPVTGPEGK